MLITSIDIAMTLLFFPIIVASIGEESAIMMTELGVVGGPFCHHRKLANEELGGHFVMLASLR